MVVTIIDDDDDDDRDHNKYNNHGTDCIGGRNRDRW